MRLLFTPSQKLVVSLLLILVSALSSQAQQPKPRPSVPTIKPAASNAAVFGPPPPYDFKVIAQTDDVINGQKIKDFIIKGGTCNVALNDKGQVAFAALTEKGEAIFRGQASSEAGAPPKRTLVAATSSTISVLGHPVIDSQGRVAYVVLHSSPPKTMCVNIDNKTVLRSGTLNKQLNTSDTAYIPYCFDAADRLVTEAIYRHNNTFTSAICINGQPNAALTQRAKALSETLGGVTNDKGQTIYMGTILGRSGGQEYPLVAETCAINNHGQIFISDRKNRLALFSYDRSLPAGKAIAWDENPLYENVYIPNATESIAKAINIPVFKYPKYPGPHEQQLTTSDFRTYLRIHDDHVFTPVTNYVSAKGVSVSINNKNQIAFFVEWPDAIGTPTLGGQFSSYKTHQALIVGTPGIAPPDLIELSKATTTDAQSVSVDYTIKEAGVKSVHFDVYRCDKQTLEESTLKNKIGGDDIPSTKDQALNDPSLVAKGDHEIKLFSGKELTPDTAREFVVVVATCNGSTSTTYFRKWMLGAVVHGYSLFAFDLHRAGIYGFSLSDLTHLSDYSLPEWETKMKDNLQSRDKYDKAIPFDWTKTCTSSEPDVAKSAGDRLTNEISKWIRLHKEHSGDVVDLHLIGHNRGAVVVSQALSNLSTLNLANDDPNRLPSTFGGGYVEVTLLDPHPVNTKYDERDGRGNIIPDVDFSHTIPEGWANEAINDILYDPKKWFKKQVDALSQEDNVENFLKKNLLYNPIKEVIGYELTSIQTGNDISLFEKTANDPPVTIPEGVKTVDIWYQHNKCSQLRPGPDLEFLFNFHGMVGPSALKSEAKYPVDLNDLSVPPTAMFTGVSNLGYMQVPDIYETRVVDLKHLNRTSDEK